MTMEVNYYILLTLILKCHNTAQLPGNFCPIFNCRSRNRQKNQIVINKSQLLTTMVTL